jgi:alpha-beta hydrolase superfamily lysophospholipase
VTRLSTFTALDGENLALQDWPLPDNVRLRGVVLIVHGLGEYAGRYDHVAEQLNGWGFAVRSYDQYGHGESGGARGALPTTMRLLEDLADVVDTTRHRLRDDTPLFLLGHSMGGLVAGNFVARGIRRVEGLIMSSPALDPGLGVLQKLMLAVVPRIAPDLCVGNGLDPQYLSHDAAVVKAYKEDPLCHDRICGRLASFIAKAGPETVARAPKWRVPTLLMYAGSDRLVNPAGSRAFAVAAPKEVVTSHCFEQHYHEIFNEVDREPVFAMLRQWLDARCAA